MRNWNPKIGHALSSFSPRFQTTYEELKQVRMKSKTGYTVASRLPMRNWNNDKKVSSIPWTVASRLPMRNWNTFWLPRSTISPTELPDYLWGIETLQELKRFFVHCRFQTTYEELKHNSLARAGWHGISASRLPMRNWNHRSSTHWQESPKTLPDYLWGIETCLFPRLLRLCV